MRDGGVVARGLVGNQRRARLAGRIVDRFDAGIGVQTHGVVERRERGDVLPARPRDLHQRLRRWNMRRREIDARRDAGVDLGANQILLRAVLSDDPQREASRPRAPRARCSTSARR